MSLNLKYNFFDYSIIRWVNNLSHFQDTFNPQNNQYFGHTLPSKNMRGYESGYVHNLLINDGRYDGVHRLPIIEYDIDALKPYPSNLKVFFVNEIEVKELPSVVKNDSDNIYYITFASNEITSSGRLEIRDEEGKVYKYSECVRFVSNIPYVIVHTRNYFNKDGFNWEYKPMNNWIRTNLPAKCLGLTNVEPDRELQRLGSKNSYEAVESRNDKKITYEYNTEGKALLLDAIEVLSGNTGSNAGFYLDLIRVTPAGEIEREEDSINGKGTYFVQMNDDYSVIEINDEDIFDDIKPVITILNPLDESIFIEGLDNIFSLDIYYNTDIQITTDLTKEIRIFKDEILIETLTPNDIVGVTNNKLEIKPNSTYSEGIYRIEVDDDFVIENTFGIFGANGLNNWNFEVLKGRIYNDNYSEVYS